MLLEVCGQKDMIAPSQMACLVDWVGCRLGIGRCSKRSASVVIAEFTQLRAPVQAVCSAATGLPCVLLPPNATARTHHAAAGKGGGRVGGEGAGAYACLSNPRLQTA